MNEESCSEEANFLVLWTVGTFLGMWIMGTQSGKDAITWAILLAVGYLGHGKGSLWSAAFLVSLNCKAPYEDLGACRLNQALTVVACIRSDKLAMAQCDGWRNSHGEGRMAQGLQKKSPFSLPLTID